MPLAPEITKNMKVGEIVRMKDGHPCTCQPYKVWEYFCEQCRAPIGVYPLPMETVVDPERPLSGHYCDACQAERKAAEKAAREQMKAQQKQEEEAEKEKRRKREEILDWLTELEPEERERLISAAPADPKGKP